MAHDEAAHHHHHQHGNHDHHQHGHDENQTAFAELLDLDAEVLRDYLAELHAWLKDLAGNPQRILDLGSGSGTGSLALARTFPQAQITAVDMSPDLLRHLSEKAAAAGARITTVVADLDTGFPQLEPVDLVWASASLHHLAEPERVLADVFATLRPGGVLAAVELDSFPRFLSGELGAVEARAHEVVDAERARRVPMIGSDWGSLLAKAGFTVEAERVFTIELTADLPAATGRYAQLSLSRMRPALQDHLAAADLAVLDELLTGDALLHRADLEVRSSRTVWIGRKL